MSFIMIGNIQSGLQTVPLPNPTNQSRSPKSSNYSAWRRYNQATNDLNEANEGRENLTKQIRCGWKYTATRIFSDYLKAKNAGKLHHRENDLVGYLETSDALIKNATGFPRRTVRDHIDRLLSTGFILEKVQEIEGVRKVKEYNFFIKINYVFLHKSKKRPNKNKFSELKHNSQV